MMVALAVFSLAALALIRLEGASFREATALDRATLAGIVARNVAVDAQTSAKVTLGTTQGDETNGGRPWHWTRIVAPVGGDRVFRVDVSVADAAGTAAKLTVVRDNPPPPPAAAPSPTPGATP